MIAAVHASTHHERTCVSFNVVRKRWKANPEYYGAVAATRCLYMIACIGLIYISVVMGLAGQSSSTRAWIDWSMPLVEYLTSFVPGIDGISKSLAQNGYNHRVPILKHVYGASILTGLLVAVASAVFCREFFRKAASFYASLMKHDRNSNVTGWVFLYIIVCPLMFTGGGLFVGLSDIDFGRENLSPTRPSVNLSHISDIALGIHASLLGVGIGTVLLGPMFGLGIGIAARSGKYRNTPQTP